MGRDDKNIVLDRPLVKGYMENKLATYSVLILLLTFLKQKCKGRFRERTMNATVHLLHAKPASIGAFLRIGHTGHRRLEALIAANGLRFRRFVFDAAHIDEQQDLLKALKRSGREIVLDPNSAEMATKGRYGSSVSKLPWGNPDRPWDSSDFGKESEFGYCESDC